MIFENVSETDRRYAEIFRGYAETVKEQMARVQVMAEVMKSACGIGLDKGTMLFEMEQNSVNQREKMILSGREILMRRLAGEENIDPADWEKICNIIEEKQPNMLVNLYITDCNSGADADRIYVIIMDYYKKHKMDITLDDVEGLQLAGTPLKQIQKETFVECWNYLFAMGLTKEQVIAVIANMYSEGELSPTNRQNTKGNTSIEDLDYVYLTDDNVGYGICQWTFYSRKEGLQNMANEMGKEVSDLDIQLAYFQYEMEESYDFRNKWSDFLAIQNREEAVENFYRYIESPASSFNVNSDEYKAELSKRTGFADDIANWYEVTFNN